MKVDVYRVLNHPTTDKVYSKTRARLYRSAGYGIEHTSEKIQENES